MKDNQIQVTEPIVRIDRTAFKQENKMIDKYEEYLLSAQLAPQSLKDNIAELLNYLKRINFSKYGDQFLNFIENDLIAEKIENSYFGNIFLFLLITLPNSSQYNNCIPKYIMENRKTISDRSVVWEGPYTVFIPSEENRSVWGEVFFFIDSKKNKEPVLILDNFIEILSYFLAKNFQAPNDLESHLLLIGYTVKTAKAVVKKATALKIQIQRHVIRKMDNSTETTTSIPFYEKQINYYKFWHIEFLKRRFYLDYQNDKSLQTSLAACLKYISQIPANHSDLCKACLFEMHDFDLKTLALSELSNICNAQQCSLKMKIYNFYFQVYFNKDTMINGTLSTESIKTIGWIDEIGKKYSFLPELLFPYSAQAILSHLKQYKELPLKEFMIDEINRLLVKDAFESGNVAHVETNMYSKSLINSYEIVKKIKKDGKQRIDNESLIIGICIWDNIMYRRKKRSVEAVVKILLKTSPFFLDVIKSKFPKKENQYYEIHTKEIIDNCRRYYKRVNDSIMDNNCKIKPL